jgi:transcriptional regulator of nitric oxide reductase
LVEDDIQEFCNRDFAEGYPDAMKIYATKLVSYQITTLTQASANNKQSESQGGYSYSKVAGGETYLGYPPEIIGGLRKWRFVATQSANKLTQYRDQRYLSLMDLARGAANYSEPGIVFDEI